MRVYFGHESEKDKKEREARELLRAVLDDMQEPTQEALLALIYLTRHLWEK